MTVRVACDWRIYRGKRVKQVHTSLARSRVKHVPGLRTNERVARVLVASLEPALCQQFTAMIHELTFSRCDVVSCHRGDEIPVLATNGTFDLFIAVMNNIVFTQDAAPLKQPWTRSALLIREMKRCHDIPVIAYCGLGSKHGGDVWLSEAKTAGADFAFSLPWDAVSFRAAVFSCLGGGTLPSGITVRS